MSDPTWLPEVLRRAGLRCDIYPGAMDRGHGDFGNIWGIVAHHTGSFGETPRGIAEHPSLGLASQLHLSPQGVYTLCGVGIAWHAGAGAWNGLPRDNANQFTIGIEAAHDGRSPWSAAQYGAYVRGCAAILNHLGVGSDRVIGHKEWAGPSQGKWDPGGIDMPTFRRQVADVQRELKTPPAPPRKDPEMTPEQDRLLREVSRQLGPWPQLGKNDKGQPLTLVDAVAVVLRQLGPWPQLGTNDKGQPLTLVDAVAELREDVGKLKGGQ